MYIYYYKQQQFFVASNNYYNTWNNFVLFYFVCLATRGYQISSPFHYPDFEISVRGANLDDLLYFQMCTRWNLY